VAVIALPPLERGRDTQLLARHFLSRYGREFGRGDLVFAPETLAALASHSWPGNVRELQNVVAQAAALADSGGVVGPALLPEALRRGKRGPNGTENYRTRMDEHRRGLIAEALERAGGNRSRAARELGLSRQALLYLIKQLGVSSRRARESSGPAPVAAGRMSDVEGRRSGRAAGLAASTFDH
jgi:DNA-binding NtrC family response regulator